MKSFRSLSFIVILTGLLSTSCSKASVETPPAPTAGAITANSAIDSMTARKFGRQNLNAGGSQLLFEFMRPEVRARLDEEPTGDADAGYDPAASEPSSGSDQSQADSAAESQQQEEQQQASGEEAYPTTAKLESKFAWAKKSFGDALKADITTNGVIVLYADDNYYDAARLIEFVEKGRDLIVERSDVGGERIQVVFGGYRSVPQVEYWIVTEGASVPEFKPEDRNRPVEPAD
jgi:hypothetical protein